MADPGAAAADPKALRATVQESCALTEREESFEYAYGGSGGEAEEVGRSCVCGSINYEEGGIGT